MSIRYREEVTTREHIQATQDFLCHLSLESNRHCTNYKRSFSERPDDESFVWSRDDARGGRKLQRFSSYPLQACTTQIRFTREIAKEDCSSRFVFVPSSNTVLAVFSVLPYKPRESSGATARGRGIFQRESSCTSGYSHTISYAELLDHPADEYDAHWLEDGVSAVNPNRTEIALPGTLISFLEFENPESYNKDTNERFKEKWPEVEITLSKMKSIKKELHKVSVSLRLPVLVLCYCYCYFETLAHRRHITKTNRKLAAGACLLIACKFLNCSTPTVLSELTDVLRVSGADVLAQEMRVLAALKFSLSYSVEAVVAHYQRIMGRGAVPELLTRPP